MSVSSLTGNTLATPVLVGLRPITTDPARVSPVRLKLL